MIWFTCKHCGKTHDRPETAVGLTVFCECGQGNVVPWESTASDPSVVEVQPLQQIPNLEPVVFEAEPVPALPSRPPPLPPRGRGKKTPRPRDPGFCLNHESVATQETCSDCGEGFCRDCLVYLQGKPLCGPCKNFRIRALHQPVPTSQLALVSLLLALFSGPLAFCLYPMGLNFGTRNLSLLALVPQLTALALGILALRRTDQNLKLGGQALALSGVATALFSTFWTIFLIFYASRLWV